MKRKIFLGVVLSLICLMITVAFATTFTYTYDTATPAGTDAPSIIDNRIREVKAALQERLNVEHVFDLTGTEVSHANTGQHTGINCTSITNTGNAVHTGTLSSTGNLTINTDKFTVTAASGNTLVAGTLDVTGAFESTGVATLADASLTKTSAAPTTDAMIANKKYVDDTPHTSGIVQIVNVQSGAFLDCNTNLPFDDTTPLNTEGDEVMTLAITPTSATNKLKIEVVVQCATQVANQPAGVALFQDSTAGALAAGMGGLGNYTSRLPMVLTHYMDAGTTSETTFKVNIGAATGGIGFNGVTSRIFGGKCASSITITEIKV